MTSVVILFVIYARVVLACRASRPTSAMQANAANILAYVGT